MYELSYCETKKDDECHLILILMGCPGMSDTNSQGNPPVSHRKRAICICKTCGSTSRSLLKATECCLGLRKQRTILSVGKPCSDPRDINIPARVTQTVQHQLSLTGSGDFCRRGCCDFSQKFAKTSCNRE
jgi:hypothetical protein